MSVIPDLTDTDYHASPALSSTGARRILKAPALYRWTIDHPKPATDTFRIGHAFHSLTLGAGRPVVLIPCDSWRKLGDQAARDEATANGQIPLNNPEWRQVEAMVAAVRAHPRASVLLENGRAELSIFHDDAETGVALKARPDWTRDDVLVDLKSAANADPLDFPGVAWKYHYEQQADWYLTAAQAAGLDPQRFVFVLAEKTPPYLVSVCELDTEAMSIGRARNRAAIDTFAECEATQTWPGYPAIEHLVPLPAYAAAQYEEEMF